MSFRRTLRRFEGQGHARYLTCSCYRRLPLFQNDRIKDAFATHLDLVQRVQGFDLFAWVIMPEHFHILLRPAEPNQTVPEILRRLKSPFAKGVIERWRACNASILSRISDRNGRHRFWQAGGGYDRSIVTEDEFFEKITYIHDNPLRRELAVSGVEYRWSSAAFYAEPSSYSGPTITRLNP